LRYVTEHIPLSDVVSEIRSSTDALRYLERIIPAFRDRAAELQAEETAILETCAELVVFMRQNALIGAESLTDSDQSNLLRLLHEEISKYTFAVRSGAATQLTKQRLDKLTEMKDQFERLLTVNSHDGNRATTPSPSAADVERLIEKLYRLPIKGRQLKQAADDAENAWRRLMEDAEGRRQQIDLNDSALLSRVISQVFESTQHSD